MCAGRHLSLSLSPPLTVEDEGESNTYLLLELLHLDEHGREVMSLFILILFLDEIECAVEFRESLLRSERLLHVLAQRGEIPHLQTLDDDLQREVRVFLLDVLDD